MKQESPVYAEGERTAPVATAESRDPESRARALVARELRRVGAGRAHGLEDTLALVACERAYRELSRSLGRIGAHAIMSRALAQAQLQYEMLKSIRFDRESEHALVGIAAIVQAHGSAAVRVAIELLLQNALAILEKMVGPDMVKRLLNGSDAMGIPDDEDAT